MSLPLYPSLALSEAKYIYKKNKWIFSNNKILFRCDAGFKNELGSGHLFRSITIAQYLKKDLNLKAVTLSS